MGGHTFESEGLKTPRIATGTYNVLKKEYKDALAPFYHHTAYAEIVPDKPDHGDVDILVETPREGTTPERIASALGAARFKRNGAVTNYAIPHPTDPDTFVQLDVQKSPAGYLPWQLFLTSYGDLSQILGVIIRPLGLTSTDRGLHVRIPEIEPTNKKASMIHLSHDPSAVLAFFGLDAARYSAADFACEADVFAWVAAGRFFNRDAVVPRAAGGEKQQRPESENHNDRARRAKRGMYRRFVEDWVPAHPDVGADCAWSRERVLEEALEAFGKREEHDERLAAQRLVWREDALWRAIKETVPRKGDSLAGVIRGLKRWVSVEEGTLTLSEEPLEMEGKKPWLERMGEQGEEKILRWVEEHWAEAQVKEKAWAAAKKAQGVESNGTSNLHEKEKAWATARKAQGVESNGTSNLHEKETKRLRLDDGVSLV
ncbi:hypothetical protein BK809_0003942 [Diplodia seriata]|uniref:Nucleotidyltransferase n=1 Tax=Diplodia seriata TaxID=420778 RepID=A0A1S8BCJ2_9PEZI|nr:hypothetical protein BK809_0003942 [Diplodia seriata]